MSEKPAGGATRERALAPMLPPWANTVWVSGSYAEPGQLVAVDAAMAPIRPLPLRFPRIGGVNGDGAYLYRFNASSACARNSGVKSMTSSGTRMNVRAYGGGFVG